VLPARRRASSAASTSLSSTARAQAAARRDPQAEEPQPSCSITSPARKGRTRDARAAARGLQVQTRPAPGSALAVDVHGPEGLVDRYGAELPGALREARDQAFIAAGAPAEAFGFYPTDHEGSGEVVKLSGRNLVFGDVNIAKMYENNPAVQVHGPGWSKIIIGEDKIENWREYLDVIVGSISDNGGRSCINASAVIVPKYGKEIATAIAERLGPVKPLPSDDENAKLSGFANVKMADYIDSAIDNDLQTPGAEDVTAQFRDGPRKTEFQGGTFLRPTIIWCSDNKHPLANREFLCPYASVLEIPQSEVLGRIGYSLIVTAITQDEAFINDLLECPTIDRLNIGPISTMKISWDQPHEGNMFEFLYKRRSIDCA
jgi:hypothetical protein